MLLHGNNGYANAPQYYVYTYSYIACPVKSLVTRETGQPAEGNRTEVGRAIRASLCADR
jgi:hypothetical protein